MRFIRPGRPVLVLALSLAVFLVLAACGGGDDEGNGNGDSNGGDDGGGKAQTVQVTLTDNVFTPKDIKVDTGEVTFELKNNGQAIHNMHIISKDAEGKDFMSKALINAGESDKFVATFTKKGTYKFQCDYHVPDMVGTITVD